MSFWQGSGRPIPRRHDMPEFQPAHHGVSASVYSRSQVALAEQLASQQVLERQAASQAAALQGRDSQLSSELRELRIASAKEIQSLRDRLDEALQDRAVLEVQLEALRTSSDLSQTEGLEQTANLRAKMTELENERNALARANMVLQQQAQTLAALQNLTPPTSAPSYVIQDQVNQLLQDRTLLMEENRRLWLELEESKAALAYEAALRSTMWRATSSLQHDELRSLHQQSVSSSQIHQAEEDVLMNSLRQASVEAATAVQRAADSAQKPVAQKRTEQSISPGTAAETVRQQVKQDKGSSATATITGRMTPNRSVNVAPLNATNTSSCTSSSAVAVQHAQAALVESRPHMVSEALPPVPVSTSVGKDSSGQQAGMRLPTAGSFQKRLSPSVPLAPSRHNSMVEHTRTLLERSCTKQDDEDVRVHFDKYADPHTYDVPPPATPHPSKGVLNPPQSPRSPVVGKDGSTSWGAANMLPHTVTIDAASPRAYAQPVPTTPHANHGVLYHTEGIAAAHDQAHRVDPARSHDRSVSFQNASGTGAVQQVTADGYCTMRCLDRSPGCTPIVSGGTGARVRMHSCPGHDNFAPLKSGTASPGGTPHAHGQGRLPTVRVSPLAAAGHDHFNPLRSQVASPGCTPVRSGNGSALGGATPSEADTVDGSGTILPYTAAPAAASQVAPGAPSDVTSQTDQMHVVVVSGPGHDHFNPVCCSTRSPGHTPRHCGNCPVTGPSQVRIMAEPGHDSFVPMHAGPRSPGHTPGPAALSAACAIPATPPGDGFRSPLPVSHRAVAHTEGPFSAQPQPHPEHVTFDASPSHDDFHPLAARNASPGHTPRPSVEAPAGPHMHVTFLSEPGHDQFEPIRDANASPGHTPHCPGVGSGQPPTLCAVCPVPGLTETSVKRVSIDVDVPKSHDCFQPMRMAEASPGQTPKGFGSKVQHPVNVDRAAHLDEADGVSCDGGAGAASVRDAAFRALESSDSIRSRLVCTDRTAEDYKKASSLGTRQNLSQSPESPDRCCPGGGGAPAASVQSHPLQHVQEEAPGSWSGASASPRHVATTGVGNSVHDSSATPAVAASDLHTPLSASTGTRVRRSVSVAGRFPLQSAASVGTRTSQSPSFSFLTPANNPAGDGPEDDAVPDVSILGLPPAHSRPPPHPEQPDSQHGNMRGQGSRHSRGSMNAETELEGAPAAVRPRSAASGSGPGALVIQPIRSMRDCSHDSNHQRSTAGSRQSSVCGSISERRCSGAYSR